MAPREAYARSYFTHNGFEVSVGIELRPGDNVRTMGIDGRAMAADALRHQGPDDERVAMEVEAMIRRKYPSRAYFIETESYGSGVQVFQPYGLPRTREVM